MSDEQKEYNYNVNTGDFEGNNNSQSSANDSNYPVAFCRRCGEKIYVDTEICPKCGVRQKFADGTAYTGDYSRKSRLAATLLCFFLGGLGIHCFYVGRIGRGIAMIFVSWLTLGIWPLVDLIIIICGSFKDSDGKKIVSWSGDGM